MPQSAPDAAGLWYKQNTYHTAGGTWYSKVHSEQCVREMVQTFQRCCTPSALSPLAPPNSAVTLAQPYES